MNNLRRSLPPLDALVAFEAAARHESFTRAAEELNLTQAAVSQRIRQLEADLGTPLFLRAHRRVRLTSRGRALQHTVSGALRQMAATAVEMRAAPDRRQVTIAVDRSIAGLWLPERLPQIRAAAPDIVLRIIVSDVESDCLADEVDLAIIHGDGTWPGCASERLFAEEVFPVCAPEYAERAAIQTPGDLLTADLIELEDERWNWLDWRAWLSESGITAPAPRRVMRISDYPTVIDAARRGLGVALGWAWMVDNDLAQGRLKRPFPETVKTPFGYYAVRPDGRDDAAISGVLESLSAVA